jgi:hypothetical protein
LGLSFKILYKQGKDNRVADALSRTTHADIHELAAMSVALGYKKFKLHMFQILNLLSCCKN